MYAIAFFVGALVGSFLISRLIRAVAFGKARGFVRAIGPNLAALVAMTVLGGLGMADGGPPRFSEAFQSYLLPVVVWVVVDGIREKRRMLASTAS